VARPCWIPTSFPGAVAVWTVSAHVDARQLESVAQTACRTLAYNPRVSSTSDASDAATTRRPLADRCPGVLRLIEAADGHLARVRLPGGFITAEQLRALARLAGEMGDGRIELTSRGNVQLRALAAGAAARLTDELAATGLLPSLDHDRVRNVLASPLAGLDEGRPAGRTDLAPVVWALDAGLCARPRLAELSGRFLLAIDDGRGDVAGLGADVVAVVRADEASVNGLDVGRDDVATVMLAFAEAFLDERAALESTAWRISDLPGGADRVRDLVAEGRGLASVSRSPVSAGPAIRPVGIVAGGSALVLLAPLGRLTVAQVGWLADHVGGRAARVTPWRSVVLPDQADAAGVLREAAALGLGVDERSPWLRVTACAGKPGCASALADVQADALSLAARWPGRNVHVSGCARHCGRPASTEIDVTATSEGYEVAGA
jgi:precorrin-3B synthase